MSRKQLKGLGAVNAHANKKKWIWNSIVEALTVCSYLPKLLIQTLEASHSGMIPLSATKPAPLFWQWVAIGKTPQRQGTDWQKMTKACWHWLKPQIRSWTLNQHASTNWPLFSIVVLSLGSMSMPFEIQFITLEVSVSYLASAKYTVSVVANLLESGSLYTSLEWGWVTFRRGRYDGFWVLQQCMQYVAYSCLFSINLTCFWVSSDQPPSAAHHRSSEIKRS